MGTAIPVRQEQQYINPNPSRIVNIIPNEDPTQITNWMLQSNNYETLLSPKAQVAYQAITKYNGKSQKFPNKLENCEIVDGETMQFKFRGSRRVRDKVIEGYGVQLENQVLYQGYFLDGLKHNHGKEIQDDGSYYFGDYIRGMKNGNGFLSVQNNIVSNSEFENNLFDGIKIHMKQKNLQKLEFDGEFEKGQFVKGKINGFNCNNQLILSYQGECSQFKMNGNGELSKKGILYKGQFKDNKQHGIGSQFDEDLKGYRKGEWVYGRKKGKFIYNREGTESVEEYHRDQRK
ncbi:Phosphatidylinositol 4-phosphate 5-kinase type-1 beta [Paramecium bursaria]